MGYHGKCPRCGCHSMEHLRTHSFCWECNYSPDTDLLRHLKFNEDGESKMRLKNKADDEDEEIESEDQDSEIDGSL